MIYILKFLAGFLLPPGIFFLLLWLLAVHMIRKHNPKQGAILFLLVTMFYCLSTPLAAEKLMGDLESVYDQPVSIQALKSSEADAIVILGGGATGDTPDLGEQGNICGVPAARLLTAYDVYKELKLPIVVSGGQVYEDSGDEALIAKRELMRMGVPEKDIVVESRSLNTRQNAVYTTRILQEKGRHCPIIVTSAFHMERSMLNFAKAGMRPIAMPTEYRYNRQHIFHYNKLAPSSSALDDSVTVIREKVRTAVTKYLE